MSSLAVIETPHGIRQVAGEQSGSWLLGSPPSHTSSGSRLPVGRGFVPPLPLPSWLSDGTVSVAPSLAVGGLH